MAIKAAFNPFHLTSFQSAFMHMQGTNT